jgi:uncharacterized cupredoxin-like copper-binding protein
MAAAVAVLVALGTTIPFALGGSGATKRVTITASEFKFKPARLTAKAGTTLVITLVNRGTVRHDLKLAGKKTRLLAPGQRATLRVKAKAGRYRFICTVPGHASQGMRGTLTVKRAPPPPQTITTES